MSAPVVRTLPRDGATRRPRVAVVNLMPRCETYEPLLTAALGPAVQTAFVRLASHGYRSSDPAHLEAHYAAWSRVRAEGPVDGVLLTGAPVETLAFEEVRYWDELRALLGEARADGARVLGVCWGAMALAATLGAAKVNLPRKVFGSFEHTLTDAGRRWLSPLDGRYRCAQSRHAGLDEASVDALEREGRVVRLARAEATGTTLLATPDLGVVMHLGHPEYEPSRIAYEWARDRAAGRPDVPAPGGFDDAGERPTLPWERDSAAFFDAWRASLSREVAR